MSYSVTFEGFDTKEQAEEFLAWYEGQGEQDAAIWMEENSDLAYVNVDINIPYKETLTGVSCTLRMSYKE